MRKIRTTSPFRVQMVARFPGAMVWTPDNQRGDRGFGENPPRRPHSRRSRDVGVENRDDLGWSELGRLSGSRMRRSSFPWSRRCMSFMPFGGGPTHSPYQPWPQKQSDCQWWVQHWLSYHVHREDFPEDLSNPLPF